MVLELLVEMVVLVQNGLMEIFTQVVAVAVLLLARQAPEGVA